MDLTQFQAAVRVARIVLEAIQEAGPSGIPDGHLYAMMQSTVGEKWTLNIHQQLISSLVEAGMITNHNHLLVAVRKTT